MRGHHELSLIQFVKGLPPMINELVEITERKPLDVLERKKIYLGAESELRKLALRQKTAEAVAELLENIGIIHEEDYSALDEKRTSEINKMIKKWRWRNMILRSCEI